MTERIQLVGEIPEPQHWPMLSMGQYGTVPGRTEPLFRIVFAPSVYSLVGGEFADGFVGYRSCRIYEYIGNKWILEKWISAAEHTGMTEMEYRAKFEDPETHLCLTGPYPRNGIYNHCHTFQNSTQIGAAGLVAALVKKAKLNSKAMNRAALEEAQRAEKNAKFQKNFDRMKDAQRVSGIRAANIGGRVKALKSFPELKDARALGLPTRGARQIKPTSGELAVAGY